MSGKTNKINGLAFGKGVVAMVVPAVSCVSVGGLRKTGGKVSEKLRKKRGLKELT